MNRLKNMRIYLAGAIDRVVDDGVTWRRNIRRELKDLDILWLDPTDKPTKTALEDSETRRQRHIAKANGDYESVAAEMKIIRSIDLRLVDLSDLLIVDLDMETHACGTYNEIFLADSQKKPVLIHNVQGVGLVPDWMYGVLPFQHFFGSWVDLIKYVREVDAGPDVETYNRWKFFDFTGGGS